MKKYIHYGSGEFQLEKYEKISIGPYRNKPIGGLWASPVDAEYGWDKFCLNYLGKDVHEKDFFCFTLKRGARVLNIDDPKILDKLPVREIWNDAPAYDIDQLAQSYDAIEVKAGSNEDIYYGMYSWDCDCILILNPDVIVTQNC